MAGHRSQSDDGGDSNKKEVATAVDEIVVTDD